jgi:hypothetical protein
MKLDKKELIKELNSDLTDEFLSMLSDEERNILLEVLISEKREGRSYNRILSNQELNSITTSAYGYLLKMYNLGSITAMDMESILSSCVSISREWNSIIDKEKMDRIITIYLFTGIQNVTSDTYLEMINNSGEFIKN